MARLSRPAASRPVLANRPAHHRKEVPLHRLSRKKVTPELRENGMRREISKQFLKACFDGRTNCGADAGSTSSNNQPLSPSSTAVCLAPTVLRLLGPHPWDACLWTFWIFSGSSSLSFPRESGNPQIGIKIGEMGCAVPYYVVDKTP